jgi:hypothetical protein
MVDSTDDLAVSPEVSAPASGEGVIHNNVLIRTHEPVRTTHSWVVPTLLGLAVVSGAAIWGYVATHPTGPMVNHAVSDAPQGFATAPSAG